MFHVLFSFIFPGILAYIIEQALVTAFDFNHIIAMILSIIIVLIGLAFPIILIILFVWLTHTAWEWNIFITFIGISLLPCISFLISEKIEKTR